MTRKKTLVTMLTCLALLIGAIAVLPAAAQEADWLVSTDRGTVGISAPAAGDTLSGTVEIMGTAGSPAFEYYKVEYSTDGEAWYPVDGEDYRHAEAVTGAALATWDTTLFPNGSYQLRAVVVDNTGNYVASEPVAVTVNNPAAGG